MYLWVRRLKDGNEYHERTDTKVDTLFVVSALSQALNDLLSFLTDGLSAKTSCREFSLMLCDESTYACAKSRFVAYNTPIAQLVSYFTVGRELLSFVSEDSEHTSRDGGFLTFHGAGREVSLTVSSRLDGRSN